MFSSKNNTIQKGVFNWKINCDFLKSSLSNNNGATFTSKVFPVKGFDKLWFSFSLKTDVRDLDNNGYVVLYFNCFTGYEEIKADLTFDVRNGSTINIHKKTEWNFINSGSRGLRLFDHRTLLGLSTNFRSELFITCKIALNINSLFGNNCFLGKKLSNSEPKDVKIIIGKKEIMANKIVLETFSPLFKKMIQASGDDTVIEITDCDYQVVKNAIDFCYGITDSLPFDFDTLIPYLQFSNKYGINDLKNEIEFKLLPKVTKENIYELSNAAIRCNANCLKAVCQSEFKVFSKKHDSEILKRIQNLDKAFAQEVLQNLTTNEGYIEMLDEVLIIFAGFFVFLMVFILILAAVKIKS